MKELIKELAKLIWKIIVFLVVVIGLGIIIFKGVL